MRKHFYLLGCSVRVIITLVFCGLGILETGAQETGRQYVPFVEEGKSWYCGYYHTWEAFPATLEDPSGEGIDCIFTMIGDTLINSKNYKKVFCQYEEHYGDKDLHYYCAVREEAYQVFIVEEKSSEERLIYDFSHPGELVTFTTNGNEYVRNGGIRHYGFLSGQLDYTLTTYRNGELDFRFVSGRWVVGVGTLSNPFDILYNKSKFDEPVFVRSCIKDGEQIFNIEWMAIPTEPSFIGNRTYTDNSKKSSSCYDLQGRRILVPSAHGLYIMGGRIRAK